MATTISPFFHQSHTNNNNHRRSSPPRSPPQITDIRHVQHRPNHTTMPLLLTNLTFRRISVSQPNFRFNQIRVNPVNITSLIPMAEHSNKTEAEKSTNLSEQVKEKEKETEKSKTVIVPTPPEKPLPGDCCGNGCIPCVWDTYYEELEEYNRLCKEVS